MGASFSLVFPSDRAAEGKSAVRPGGTDSTLHSIQLTGTLPEHFGHALATEKFCDPTSTRSPDRPASATMDLGVDVQGADLIRVEPDVRDDQRSCPSRQRSPHKYGLLPAGQPAQWAIGPVLTGPMGHRTAREGREPTQDRRGNGCGGGVPAKAWIGARWGGVSRA